MNKEEELKTLEEIEEELATGKDTIWTDVPVEEEEEFVEEEKTPLEEWINLNKSKAGYKDHKELWNKYVNDDLDSSTYDQLQKALSEAQKSTTKDYAAVLTRDLKGYFDKGEEIFKANLPASYKEPNFKNSFPSRNKNEFIKHMLNVITGLGTNNYFACTPLHIMAHFGISRETLKEWINDGDLKTSAEDTHKELSAKELWDIYDIKFQAITTQVAMPAQIEKQPLHSLATDTKLGVNPLSEDDTFIDTEDSINFEEVKVTAVEQSVDWDSFLKEEED